VLLTEIVSVLLRVAGPHGVELGPDCTVSAPSEGRIAIDAARPGLEVTATTAL
jgi:hypothetical protein